MDEHNWNKMCKLTSNFFPLNLSKFNIYFIIIKIWNIVAKKIFLMTVLAMEG